ncbi:hypothetical protein [Thalassovita sp.]|uniref:hypothetical protein n=1 Tax=Thalassovita sp. TaxID=1979401 RepID=UPI0029DE8986|nr:hypothetical protein [Thalassovita sp.]
MSNRAPIALLPDHFLPEGTTRDDYAKPKFTLQTISENMKEQAEGFTPGGDVFAAMQRAVLNSASLDKDRNRLIELGKAEIIKAMKSGAVRAFAFEEPRKLSDLPVELESNTLLNADFLNWESGKLHSQGLRFIELRFIADTNATSLIAKWRTEEGTGASILTNPTNNPVGRPSVKAEIQTAFNALLAAGKIDLKAAKRTHYPLIRQWLAVHCSTFTATDTSPGDETIRRAITPMLERAARDTPKL